MPNKKAVIETVRMRTAVRLLTAAFLAPAALAAQSGGGAFLVRLGNDTIFVEQYTRTPDRLEGDQLSRAARQTTLRHFVARFSAHGALTSFELSGRPVANPGAPPQVVRASFEEQTATVELTIGASTRTLQLHVPAGTLPYVNLSFALLELVTERARGPGGGDPYALEMLPLGSTAPFTATVSRAGPDSVAIVLGEGNPIKVRVDAQGRVLGASGRGTTQQVSVERVPALDIQALAGAFANRPLGQLSPRDSVHATIAGAELSVDYGRPSRRGREIFGTVVPWNQVWRTGANAATGFRTSADLVMAGRTIPAGAYTLWTLPAPTGWKLIVNQQTGQWGTEYDASRDLVRLDMTVERLAQPVEQFTIRIEPQGSGGVLTMEWEQTRAWVPFTRK